MIEEINKKLSTFSLPSKPKTFGQEYSFPEQISEVLSSELGNWMFKLAAWKGYTLRLYATLEIEKSWLENKHNNRIAKQMTQMGDKRVYKDQAMGQLILVDEEFRKIKEQLTSKEIELDSLKQVIEIYTMQLEILSREISRRTLDMKLQQRGITNE